MASNVPALSIDWSFTANLASAADLVDAGKVDFTNGAIESWAAAVNTAFDTLLRSDGTMADELVRYRNLHPEVVALLGSEGEPGADGEDGEDGTDGDPGPAGEDGEDGTDGSVWTVGSGEPADENGADGDFYLRTTTGEFYQKAAGTWGSPIGTLKGDDGEDGDDGDDGVIPNDWAGAEIYNFKNGVVVESGTTCTLSQASHGGRLVLFTNVSGCAVTCPTAMLGFGMGWKQAAAAGQITFAAGASCTLENASSHTKSRAGKAQGTIAYFEDTIATLAGDTAA